RDDRNDENNEPQHQASRRRAGAITDHVRGRRNPLSGGWTAKSSIVKERHFRAAHSRSTRNGWFSTLMAPGPISSSARTIRPSRPSALSARLTISRFGDAMAEAAR